jgi:hypothetical protein
MKGRSRSAANRLPPGTPEFDLAKAWANSKYDPTLVYRIWRALYKAHSSARKQFPDVDWTSLIVILDIIAMARANRRRVDISYLAEEMGWPRTTALSRLRVYAAASYLTFTRLGRHTYVDDTPKAKRKALKVIDALIDGLDHDLLSETDK